MLNFWELRLFFLFTLCFFIGAAAMADAPEFRIPGHDLNLEGLQKNALDGVKRASEQGFCSPDVYEAGIALRDLIFYKTSKSYNAGRARTVWERNEGLQNYFIDQSLDYPELTIDKAALIDRLRVLDEHFPPKLGQHGPSLESVSHYNAYEEALKITKGNVVRAATLIGSVGHDDVANFRANSNLFAPNSIGVTVPADVFKKFKEAGERCSEIFGPTSQSCDGVGSSFNYHVNLGFFLGCFLAKKGFGKAGVSKLFADGAAAAFNDPYLEKELVAQEKTGKLFNRQYQFELCSDIPKLLGYFYKKTTMTKWLTKDALELYERGYRLPFMERDGKNPVTKPDDWSDGSWRAAIANLDYRLAHLEYGSKQSAAGAKKGAELCSEYIAEVKPKGLGTEAETLYKMGNTNPDTAIENLLRVPAPLKNQPEKLAQAWNELSTALKKIRPKLGYEDAPVGTNDSDKNIEHAISMLADREVHTQMFGGDGTYSNLTDSVRARISLMDEQIRKFSAAEIFEYLKRKAARTELTVDTDRDAERQGRLLYWAMRNDPASNTFLLEYLNNGPSDFLKRVILSSERLSQRDSAEAVSRMLPQVRDPLLSNVLRIVLFDASHDQNVIDQAVSRIGDLAPTNLVDVGALFLRRLRNGTVERHQAITKLITQYEKLSDADQKKLLTLFFEQAPVDPDFLKLVAPEIKSKDFDRVRIALGALAESPSTAKDVKPDLERLNNSSDERIRRLATRVLDEIPQSEARGVK